LHCFIPFIGLRLYRVSLKWFIPLKC
jgi:hypothetical protein